MYTQIITEEELNQVEEDPEKMHNKEALKGGT
jgi:hypothetical protein